MQIRKNPAALNVGKRNREGYISAAPGIDGLGRTLTQRLRMTRAQISKFVGRLARPASLLPGGIVVLALAGCGGGGGGGDVAISPPVVPPTDSAAPAITAVSNRPDLVSGGDVLVRVVLPRGTDVKNAVLALNGQSLTDSLHSSPDGNGFLALVAGLTLGENTLTVTVGEKEAKLNVVNHPNGGPIFSGAQIQPWSCLPDALDEQCNRPIEYKFHYMAVGEKTFKPYSSDVSLDAVQHVTNEKGVSVPYVVRVEYGTQNRNSVAFAVLFDPSQPWKPWAPQKGWNGGVHILQGAGCGTGYTEVAAGSPLNDNALRKGYLVATMSLIHNTHNCNPVVQGEAVVMAKERIAEQYGPIDFTFGQGSSGGAISQLAVANAYPGLYDGIIISAVFADGDASRLASYDCKVVYDYWAKAGTIPFTADQKQSVVGMLSGCDSHVNTARFDVYNPSLGTNCTIPVADRYNEWTNPTGVRCTLQDYQVNLVGRRPDGFANGRLDNVGVQYGLLALRSGKITPAQFVEMNAAIGGHDINFNRLTTRTTADRPGLAALYRSGINMMANNMGGLAILEVRTPATDFHQAFHTDMLRARLDRAQGHHDNHVLWRTMNASGDPALTGAAFDTMAEWIRKIKADTGSAAIEKKVLGNKPALARDRCTLGDGVDQSASACPRPIEVTRVLAGQPDTMDIGKCQLKPISTEDYLPAILGTQELSMLNQVFPEGVCNYSKPLLDITPTIPWMSYKETAGQQSPPGSPLPAI